MLHVIQHVSGGGGEQLIELTETRHRLLAHEFGFTFTIDRRPFSGRACLEKLDSIIDRFSGAAATDVFLSLDHDHLIIDGSYLANAALAFSLDSGFHVGMCTWRRRLTAGTLFARPTETAWVYLSACRSRAIETDHLLFPWFFESCDRRTKIVSRLAPLWDSWGTRRSPRPVIAGFHCLSTAQRLAAIGEMLQSLAPPQRHR